MTDSPSPNPIEAALSECWPCEVAHLGEFCVPELLPSGKPSVVSACSNCHVRAIAREKLLPVVLRPLVAFEAQVDDHGDSFYLDLDMPNYERNIEGIESLIAFARANRRVTDAE